MINETISKSPGHETHIPKKLFSSDLSGDKNALTITETRMRLLVRHLIGGWGAIFDPGKQKKKISENAGN